MPKSVTSYIETRSDSFYKSIFPEGFRGMAQWLFSLRMLMVV